MIKMKRALALMLVLILCCSTSLAAKKKATEYTAREITTEVVQDIPAEIQNMLDIAYEQLIETDGKNLKEKNKYTKWRNDYKFEWCGGFVTWCMLEAGIPMEEKNKIEDGEVEGAAHQINGFHLFELVDALGDLVVAHAALRGHLHLDKGFHLLAAGVLPVDQCMIAADHLLRFHIRDIFFG